MSTHSYPEAAPAEAARERYALTGTLPLGSHTHRRISWAAVIAGVVLAIAVQLLLITLGAGIGLGFVHTTQGETPNPASFGISAAAWWVVSLYIALAFAGYVAGWLAGVEIRFDGVLHGLVTWGITTLLTFYLLTTALGGIIGGGFTVLRDIASMAAQARPQVARVAGVTPDTIQQQAEAYLRPVNPDPAAMSPQDAQKEIASALATYAAGGEGAAAAKERIITIMAAQMRLSRDEATRRFDDIQARTQQTVQSVKEAADTAAQAVSRGAILAFAVLVIGAIAAGAGGALGVQRRVTVVARRVR
jgi:hypothetical protein